jgi:hypothetical protein
MSDPLRIANDIISKLPMEDRIELTRCLSLIAGASYKDFIQQQEDQIVDQILEKLKTNRVFSKCL